MRQLWLLSTVSCLASCMWPREVSYAVLRSPLLSCRPIVYFAFPSFLFHVRSRCWGIVHFSSCSDVQSIAAACSVVCLLFPSFSLLNISSFLILSLLVNPSILPAILVQLKVVIPSLRTIFFIFHCITGCAAFL